MIETFSHWHLNACRHMGKSKFAKAKFAETLE